jgi:ABC-type transport system involved in multi-copper enzyme maturation permease subunit
MSLLHAELLAARKRPGVWIVGGAWTALAAVFGMLVPYIVYLAVRGKPADSGDDPGQLLAGVLPDRFVAGTASLYPMFGSAMMLILGAVLFGGEYRWGTWNTLLIQRPGRVPAVLGKFAATALVLLGITLAVTAVTAAASALIALAAGRAAQWPGPLTVLQGVGAGWLVSMAAAALGAFLAVLFRGTGAAIGVGLVWLLAVENLVSGIVGMVSGLKVLQQLLIGPNGGSLASALAPAGAPPSSVPGVVSVSSPATATLVLLAYVVVLAAATAWLIRRRDTP